MSLENIISQKSSIFIIWFMIVYLYFLHNDYYLELKMKQFWHKLWNRFFEALIFTGDRSLDTNNTSDHQTGKEWMMKRFINKMITSFHAQKPLRRLLVKFITLWLIRVNKKSSIIAISQKQSPFVPAIQLSFMIPFALIK